MQIHKEGTGTIVLTLVILVAINFLVYKATEYLFVEMGIGILSIIFFLFILSFFRNPHRDPKSNDGEVLSPCDGRIVVIEEAEEPEYFKEKRIQVSIFMSPLNVHVNYYPVPGRIKYVQYHPGKHLVAWHPKSSLENERSTVVIENQPGEILVRQIAGTVARRIVTYSKKDHEVKVGEQMGFIKFGSRVDLFFPLNSTIKVKLGDNVKGASTVIGSFSGI